MKKSKYSVDIPLYIDLPRKTKKDRRIYLNLNVYRNLDPFSNNSAKQVFKQQILEQLDHLPNFDMIMIQYHLYLKDKRLRDTSNICSIVDKFFCDALVETGILPDDNYEHVVGVSYVYMGQDKANPRVTAFITERDKPFY